MPSYRVINTSTKAECTVQARSPEIAAQEALGRRVVRSGAPRDLLAKVYWKREEDPTSMVRLYSPIAER